MEINILDAGQDPEDDDEDEGISSGSPRNAHLIERNHHRDTTFHLIRSDQPPNDPKRAVPSL